MENLDPLSPKNQRWENGMFFPFVQLYFWFGGGWGERGAVMGGLLFHFILSKFVDKMVTDNIKVD